MRRDEIALRLPFEVLGSIEQGVNEVRRYHDDILDCERVGKRFDLTMVHPSVVPEAKTLQAIRHANVVEVVGAAYVDGYSDPTMRVIEIITPFYPRGSITDALLRGETFDPRTAVQVAQAALRGLREMHVQHRLLHRDVKSGNILLDAPPVHAVVADLGMAGHLDAAGKAASASNAHLYSPPELFSGEGLTVASDIYGMGLVLRELLGGAFDYGSYTREEVHAALSRHDQPLRPGDLELPPWVPTSLRRVYVKATSRDPGKRYQSAKEMDDALAKVAVARWHALEDGVFQATGYGSKASTVRVEVSRHAGGYSLAIKRSTRNSWRRLAGCPDVVTPDLDSKQARSVFDVANGVALGP